VSVPEIPALVKITCPWCHGGMALCYDGMIIKSLPNTSRLAKLEAALEAAGALLESMRMADRLNSQEARVLEKRIEEVKP